MDNICTLINLLDSKWLTEELRFGRRGEYGHVRVEPRFVLRINSNGDWDAYVWYKTARIISVTSATPEVAINRLEAKAGRFLRERKHEKV